jgi:tRNA/rRNA methyltransferase
VNADLEVVLVRPKEDGNVGAVARAAKNFGVPHLTMVAPRAELGQTARRRAMAGISLLEKARIVPTFREAISEADLVIGTTDLVTGRSTAYLRRSVPPERLGEALRTVVGRVAIVFGPEDNGLSRSELARCDLLVHVPARREFPTLNLSHAVAIVLYAIHRARGTDDPESTPAPEIVPLDGKGKEIFLTHLGELLEQTGYPSHKRAGMILLFRRVLGRATPGESEYRMMLGLLKSSSRAIRRSHGR